MSSERWSVREAARLTRPARTEQTLKRWIKRGWLIATITPQGYRVTLAALRDAELVATLARQHRLGEADRLLAEVLDTGS